jgi:hypothetical protein
LHRRVGRRAEPKFAEGGGCIAGADAGTQRSIPS